MPAGRRYAAACEVRAIEDEVDARPGAYYVSFVYGQRYGLAAGPFPTHREALEHVERARITGEGVDPNAIWYAWGTCRLERDHPWYNKPGVLNEELGLKLGGPEWDWLRKRKRS